MTKRKPVGAGPHARPLSSPDAAAGAPTQQITVSLSLPEIHAILCPACRDAVLDLLVRKSQSTQIRNALRAQLEAGRDEAPSSPS